MTLQKIRLSLIIPLLLISFRPKPLRKTNSIIGEAIKPLGIMLLRLQRMIKIRPKTWATSNIIPASRRVTMQTSALKKQKTSSNLGNLYVNDWENGGNKRTGMGTLYLLSFHLQGSDWGPTRLKKQCQCNESSFCLLVRPQNSKDQRWSSENRWHYSKDLWDSSFHHFYVR